MKNNVSHLVSLFVIAGACCAVAAEKIVVKEYSGPDQSIPITVKGFTGEVDAVLRFDLAAQGFEFVTDNVSPYLVSGKNNGNVEGHLHNLVTGKPMFGKAYAGGSLRTQAHALADDIVFAITGQKGIARTKIAFKNDTGSSSEILVADFDGGNARAISADGAIVAAPTWVPGQNVLYYTSYKLNNPDIFRHELATGARSVIARYSGLNTSAAISTDGSKVAMVLSKSGSPNIWICNADGSGLKQLTSSTEGDSSPCWSPDGRTICYSSRARGPASLYTVSVSGGTPKRLSHIGASNATEPDWSPDGKTIVFTRQAGAFEICTVPATGGEAKILATGEDPSWAPNSRTVIFAKRSAGKRTLSLLDVPTKRVKDLPRISGSSSQPSWAR